AHEIVDTKRRRPARGAAGGERVVGAGDVVAEGDRGRRAHEEGAGMPHLGGKRRRGATGEEHVLGRSLVGGADGRTEIASAIERNRPRALERTRDAVQERLVVRDERGEGTP